MSSHLTDFEKKHRNRIKVDSAPSGILVYHNLQSVWPKVNYLVNESDGAIDMHYAYLFTLQGGVTTHSQACAVLGHKFANLREAEGEMETVSGRSKEEKKKRQEVQQEKQDDLMVGNCMH